MPVLCFDPVTGAAGNMILAALFELGAHPETVDRAVRSAGVEGFEIEYRPAMLNGIRCGWCDVHLHDHAHPAHPRGAAAPGPAEHGHEHEHEHEHDHEHHHHGHEHEHGHAHGHEHVHETRAAAENAHQSHEHRGLREVLEIVARADVPERVRARATAIFRRLAEAEGAVHGIPAEDVHFHEVGAVDAIVDILGACVALEELGVEHVYCTPLKVGSGTIRCAHGVLPVPAPATVQLLRGHEFVRLPIESELTTPTGAAILTTLSEGDWSGSAMRMLASGTGRGTKEFPERPNVVRAYLMADVAVPRASAAVDVLETDIDDDSPEAVATLPDLLREAGALDASLTPLIMKKGRGGWRLTAVVRESDTRRLAELILDHSSTIGVRVSSARRFVLPRGQADVETPWGTVAGKRIERPSGIEVTPEFDSAKAVAQRAGVPVRLVMNAARRWTARSEEQSSDQ